ncbi:MAG: hypothetical protein M3N22_08520 [Acidobacteriota bacterium]|nr:hypothetical protein [Acidobacteriota bacterium]
MHNVTFYVLGGIAVTSASLMISRRKPLNTFPLFVLTLLAVAGIFLQLHSGLLFAAQLVAILCALIGLIIFAVEVTRFDVRVAALEERDWAPKIAALVAALCVLLQIASIIVLRRYAPGEGPTLLLPQTWPKPALPAGAWLRFIFSGDLLSFVLALFLIFVAFVGSGTLSRRKA